MDRFFVSSGKRTQGPFTAEDLRRLVENGELALTDSVWSAEGDRWVEVAELEPVRKLLSEEKPSSEQAEAKRIIAFASGKGGVGKTVLSASVATALAVMGRRVLLVDGDLGGPDLHVQFGLLGRSEEGNGKLWPENAFTQTPLANLRLLRAEPGVLGAAHPPASQRLRFLRAIYSADADDVILDLGAGTSYLVLDLFVSVDVPVLVATPDPMSLQEAFNLVKLGLIWKVIGRGDRPSEHWEGVLGKGMDGRGLALRTPIPELISRLERERPELAAKWKGAIAAWRPQLLLNMVRNGEERKEAGALQIACKDLLGVELGYLGHVDWDPSVREAVNQYRPFLLYNPEGPAARSLAKLVAVRFLGKGQLQGFFAGRRMRKAAAEAGRGPVAAEARSEVICSYRCSYWGDCEFQRGGEPCPVRQFEAVFRTAFTSS